MAEGLRECWPWGRTVTEIVTVTDLPATSPAAAEVETFALASGAGVGVELS